MESPERMNAGGAALWQAVTEAHELDAVQLVQLTEACRAKDRLDKLDRLLTGDIDTWCQVDVSDGRPAVLVINKALSEANSTANLLKQLLAALRLPDATSGKKPQFRGARGAYAPRSAKVPASERARLRSVGE